MNPNPFNGILNPPRGQPIDWSSFRSILLFGQFPKMLRTQYSAQYNLTVKTRIAGQHAVPDRIRGIAGTPSAGLL